MDTVKNGQPLFTTKPLERAQAFAFGRAIEANPTFCNVYVVPAKGDRFRVQYQPADDSGLDGMRARRLQESVARALQEGGRYTWDRDESGRFYRVETLSGETYEVAVDGSSCSCLHYETRLKAIGNVGCKHVIAYRLGLGKRADGKPLRADVLNLEWE